MRQCYHGKFDISIRIHGCQKDRPCKANYDIYVILKGHIMWLDNLREYRIKAGNPSDKAIAEKSGVSARNVARIFAGEIKTPYAETLDHIVKAMGFTLTDIFSETKVVIGDEKFCELKEQVEVTTAELDNVSAEHDMLVAENNILKTKVATLSAEVDMLRMKLEHKDEIIALHNYYIKKSNT